MAISERDQRAEEIADSAGSEFGWRADYQPGGRGGHEIGEELPYIGLPNVGVGGQHEVVSAHEGLGWRVDDVDPQHLTGQTSVPGYDRALVQWRNGQGRRHTQRRVPSHVAPSPAQPLCPVWSL